jgi:uncharacterized protein (TIRG00374 family)
MKNFSGKKIPLIVISIVLFYAIFSFYSDFNKVSEHLRNIEIIYLAPIFGILSISVIIRSLIQRLLLINIGIKLSVKENLKIFLSGLSMLITPGGSGVLIKSYLMHQKYGHNIVKTMPLVFVERFYDVVGIILLIAISSLFVYSIEAVMIIMPSTAIVFVLIYLLKTRKSLKFVIRSLKKIKFFDKILSDDQEFYDSLNSLFQTKTILTILALVTSLTFFESLMFYFGFLSFGIDLGFFTSIQTFYASVLFGSFFLIPGGIGATEGLFVTLLTQKNIELSLASSLIIFLRLSTIWFLTAVGFFVILRNVIKNN